MNEERYASFISAMDSKQEAKMDILIEIRARLDEFQDDEEERQTWILSQCATYMEIIIEEEKRIGATNIVEIQTEIEDEQFTESYLLDLFKQGVQEYYRQQPEIYKKLIDQLETIEKELLKKFIDEHKLGTLLAQFDSDSEEESEKK